MYCGVKDQRDGCQVRGVILTDLGVRGVGKVYGEIPEVHGYHWVKSVIRSGCGLYVTGKVISRPDSGRDSPEAMQR